MIKDKINDLVSLIPLAARMSGVVLTYAGAMHGSKAAAATGVGLYVSGEIARKIMK